MHVKLTEKFVQTVKPPATGRLSIADASTLGLTLRVTTRGEKSWQIRYRPKGQSQRYEVKGPYPTVSLADARQRAAAIYAAARHGIDLPETERAARKAEEVRELERVRQARTLSWLLGEYVENYCKASQRRWTLTKRMFEMHVTPTLGSTMLNEVRRVKIVELLDMLQSKKKLAAQVNRVRSQLVAAFNWAIERGYMEVNPVAAIKKRRVEHSRTRVLNDDELCALWGAACELPDPSRTLVKMWILTGQRRDEVRCMGWSELDLKRGIWAIPGSRNKSKRDHEVPLSEQAVALLQSLPRLGDYVFTVNGKKPYAGQKRLKDILDCRSSVGDWTFHDLRRTASTGMAALGVSQEVIDRVLNHAQKGLSSVYNRHLYVSEKRQALAAWADYVSSLVREVRSAA